MLSEVVRLQRKKVAPPTAKKGSSPSTAKKGSSPSTAKRKSWAGAVGKDRKTHNLGARHGGARFVGVAVAPYCAVDAAARGRDVNRLGAVVGKVRALSRGCYRSYQDDIRHLVVCWVDRISVVVGAFVTRRRNEEDAFIRLSGATDLPSDALGGWASYL